MEKLVSKTAISLNVINKNRTRNRFLLFYTKIKEEFLIKGIIKTHISNVAISRAKDKSILLINIKILDKSS